MFEKIFDQILKQAISYGFVDMDTVYGDSTHQKANANKNKYTDEEVETLQVFLIEPIPKMILMKIILR